MAERVRTRSATETPVEWVPLWSDPVLRPWAPGTPNALRRTRGWDDSDFVVMYSGNMGLGHRFGEFLGAAERLGPSGPHWAFVGDGARRDEIATFIEAHPTASVSLHPYVGGEDLRESLSSADVHLASLSSAWQGLIVPSKIQAIFAVERPVIFVGPRANEVAAWIEESGGGWRVDENDVDGLLAAIEQSRDPGERRRRGTAALTFARERFDRDTNCRRLARLVDASLDVPRMQV
jgi:colanic acid biosynthesis glycosyl transferase WcaI